MLTNYVVSFEQPGPGVLQQITCTSSNYNTKLSSAMTLYFLCVEFHLQQIGKDLC